MNEMNYLVKADGWTGNRQEEREILAIRNTRDYEVLEINSEKDIPLQKMTNSNGKIVLLPPQNSECNKYIDYLIDNDIDKNRIVVWEHFFEKRNISMTQTQLDILQEVLNASKEEVTSFEYMHDVIIRYGVYPFYTSIKNESSDITWSTLGVLQTVDEFTQFCNYIATLYVNKAIEIGVMRGRSSYLICALLMRNNSAMEYDMVDIADQLDGFLLFHEILPVIQKRIPKTSEDFINQEYDFVFIDGDHSYDGSIRDFNNVGRFAKQVTIFHDIYGHEYDVKNGGIVRTWKEVMDYERNHETYVFSKYPNKWMGIGVLEWKM